MAAGFQDVIGRFVWTNYQRTTPGLVGPPVPLVGEEKASCDIMSPARNSCLASTV
jgi:hypothetical protein